MSRIVKSTQISEGTPYQLKMPLSFHTIKRIEIREEAAERADLQTDGNTAVDPDCGEVQQDVREEAAMIIKEAEYEAQKIRKRAEEEANSFAGRIRKEAREAGYREGYEAGLTQAKQEYESLIEEAVQLRRNTEMEYAQSMEAMEGEVVELVLEIARQVIAEEVLVNRENLFLLVRKALSKCSNRENIILRVSRDDEPYLMDNRERLQSLFEGMGPLEIKADLAMKQGSCVIDTPCGGIDAGVDTQLAGIEEAFRQIVLQS